MVKPINEIGNVYGRLTVVKEIGRRRGAVLFLCKCECGNYNFEVTGCDLRSGRVNSCGCFKSEMRIEENTTHGLRCHRIYKIYHNMITRCYNNNYDKFENYGGRGIRICDEWLDKENRFMNFYKWSMDNSYNENLSIDRINVNGNYEPNNCRWATDKEQANNKRNTHYVEINGEVKSLSEWCEIYKIKYKTALYRINAGWDIFNIFKAPTK